MLLLWGLRLAVERFRGVIVVVDCCVRRWRVVWIALIVWG